MLEIIILLAVGIIIGWNLPQPAYAKSAQDWIVAKMKELVAKVKAKV